MQQKEKEEIWDLCKLNTIKLCESNCLRQSDMSVTVSVYSNTNT